MNAVDDADALIVDELELELVGDLDGSRRGYTGLQPDARQSEAGAVCENPGDCLGAAEDEDCVDAVARVDRKVVERRVASRVEGLGVCGVDADDVEAVALEVA